MSESKSLLLITCSTKGEQSSSIQLAQHFVAAMKDITALPDFHVDHLDLWQQKLPELDALAVAAKYAVFSGEDLTAEQHERWQEIERHIARFCSADAIAIALPVWNFSVPYKLKHYIDVITQPKSCFTWTPADGYTSLMPARPAYILSSSASDYADGAGNEQDDFCLRYLERWLTVYMNCNVESVADAPTAHAPDIVEKARSNAYFRAENMAKELHRAIFPTC